MMSKRVYVDFARMIRTQKHKIAQNIELYPKSEEKFNAGAEKMLSMIIDEMITLFQSDNPNFDADKFLSACEIKEESK